MGVDWDREMWTGGAGKARYMTEAGRAVLDRYDRGRKGSIG
jgi:hypothetical protein